MQNVEFLLTDGTATLRRHLKGYLRRLRRGKEFAVGTGKSLAGSNLCDNAVRSKEREEELEALMADWPRLIPSNPKRMLIEAFNAAISKDALSTFVCASCSGKYFVKYKRTLGLDDFDINVLGLPDHFDPSKGGDEQEHAMVVDTDATNLGPGNSHCAAWLRDA
ncbi:hypothetical protein B0H13DRAFT_2302625 [Mycena leptocephala]|nr:hypothetical protein B0H13DRAFT_2302625 [Mycena leptocephala]